MIDPIDKKRYFLFPESHDIPSSRHGFVNERFSNNTRLNSRWPPFSREQSTPRASTSIINETNENFVASSVSDTVFDYGDGAE